MLGNGGPFRDQLVILEIDFSIVSEEPACLFSLRSLPPHHIQSAITFSPPNNTHSQVTVQKVCVGFPQFYSSPLIQHLAMLTN